MRHLATLFLIAAVFRLSIILPAMAMLPGISTPLVQEGQVGGNGTITNQTRTMSFIDCITSTTNATTYNPANWQSIATGVSAGNAVLVVVGVLAEDSATSFHISSMTIDGASASEHTDQTGTLLVNSGFYTSNGEITNADSINVSVTMSEAVTGATICVWILDNLSSTTPQDAVSDSDTASGALVLEMTYVANSLVMSVTAAAGIAAACFWNDYLIEVFDNQNAEMDYAAAESANTASTFDFQADWGGTEDAVGSSIAFY